MTNNSQVGLQFAAKACFDVREAPALWGLMELLAEVSPFYCNLNEVYSDSTQPTTRIRWRWTQILSLPPPTQSTQPGTKKIPKGTKVHVQIVQIVHQAGKLVGPVGLRSHHPP